MRVLVSVLALATVLALQPGDLAQGGVDQLTLEQQVGHLILLSFPGKAPPKYVRDALREQRVAGVILFGGNIASPTQLRELTKMLRGQGERPIVAVDQEGGEIRRVPWAGPVRGAPEQVAAGTVRAEVEAASRALRSVGITVNLAPVADVPSAPRSPHAKRAFSRDPAKAGGAVEDAVVGWRLGGIAATAKHSPGLGGARANTDRAGVTIRRSRAALEAVDLAPFEAAIRVGVPLVMVGHARYPALDRSRIASQSRPIIEGLLRDELGFRGVVVTDSMEARASRATGSITWVSEKGDSCRRRPAAADREGLLPAGVRALARCGPRVPGIPRSRPRVGRARPRAQGSRARPPR
jgi:beta-N-acetylhexosaminidase